MSKMLPLLFNIETQCTYYIVRTRGTSMEVPLVRTCTFCYAESRNVWSEYILSFKVKEKCGYLIK